MKKSRAQILKYVIEFLIVAFGVFLGVYVSEWKSQKKTDENTERTLSFIVDEISTNITSLESAIEYQSSLVISLDSLINGLKPNDFEAIFYSNDNFKFSDLPNYQGLRFANLENIMFESAKINGVLQELNISTTQLIARVYQKQQSYLEFGDQVNGKFLNITSESKVVDVLSIFELMKYDGLSTEKWLLRELRETKKQLEKTKHNNVFKR